MDLRSREKEKRTLHWFVNGQQQKEYVKGVPHRVKCGVLSFISFLFLFHLYYYYYCLLIFTSVQICTSYRNDSIEFVRLEELKEPRVREIEGEKGYNWNKYHINVICDICHHGITEGEDVYHCSIEGYDLCSDCYSTNPSIHPHPLTHCIASSKYPPPPHSSHI